MPKATKLLLYITFTLLVVSCKKCKKGVLEIKHTYALSTFEPDYYTTIVDDGLYTPNTEFRYKYNSNIETWTGYYWPDKSAKSLGYSHRCKAEDLKFKASSECSGKYSGENGHWPDASNTSGGSGGCPEGTWYSPACGDPHGVIWKFGSDKKGSFSNKDCQGICTPMVFTFTYSMSGTACSITYDAVQPYVKCTGYPDTKPPKPTDADITLSCSGSGLTVTSGNGTTTFTK